jgi:hypothetical protein
VVFVFLILLQRSLPRAISSLGTRVPWGRLSARALCRPNSAEWPLPRVPSQHSMCREELALGKAMDSGSAYYRTHTTPLNLEAISEFDYQVNWRRRDGHM